MEDYDRRGPVVLSVHPKELCNLLRRVKIDGILDMTTTQRKKERKKTRRRERREFLAFLKN